MVKLTKEEIKALKEIAQQRIEHNKLFLDKNGKPYPYRNKYETWDDAYINLKHDGFTHNQIIERIGRKQNVKKQEKNNNNKNN